MKPSAKITKSFRKEDIQHNWWVVDAAGQTVGRLATQVAILLRGKHKPNFTPHVDVGDYVIVINADKAVFQGKRAEQKEYAHHTMYPGGRKVRKYTELKKTKPEFILEHAINGMIPKTKLGASIRKKLRVYSGSEHKHTAQQPVEFKLT